MKICVTGLRGMPGVMGGVETHCEELLPRVAEAQPHWDIEVCGRSHYMRNAPQVVGRVKVTPLPSTIGKSSEAFTSTFISVLHARRVRAAVVHIHAVGPALFSPLARLLGMKVVFTHHGADYDRAKWSRLAKFVLRLGERAGFLFANKIICVSPSLRETMAKRYPAAASRTVFIPNGAAMLPMLGREDEDILSQFSLTANSYILGVARLVPEKGLETLIKAHQASGTGKLLVIAGGAMHGDSYAAELKAMAGDNVKFLGAVPRDVVGALYRSAAIFVLPSFHEGLPIAALEALSADCPMLLSDIPANLDVGLPPAHYFPVGDIEALAQRLMPGQEKIQAALADVKVRFDWDLIAKETAGVYHSLEVRQRAAWRGAATHPPHPHGL